MSAAQATPADDAASTAEREIVVTRVFDAPRELVFDAFTDPAHIGEWWGPNGFTTTVHEMDARPGGLWLYVMHGPDGTDYDNWVRYTEVARPERLVYDHGEHVGEDPWFHVTVTFADEGGKTRVGMRMVFPTAEARDQSMQYGAVEGGNQTLGRLAEYLAKK